MTRKREPGYIPGSGKCQGRGCNKTLSLYKKPSRAGRWHTHYSDVGKQHDVLLCPECYNKSRR